MAISTPTTSSSLSLLHLPPSFSSPLLPKSLHFRRHPSSSPSFSSSSSKPRRVSTAPVQQPPAPNSNFPKEISRLQTLISRLRNAHNLRDKLMVLNTDATVHDFFTSTPNLPSLDAKDEFLVKCLVAAGQGHVLGPGMRRHGGRGGGGYSGLKEALVLLAGMVGRRGLDGAEDEGKYEKLLETLNDVEEFYDCVGGIIG